MFIGIADHDARRRDAVSVLIRIELGLEVRCAPTLNQLLRYFGGETPALIVVEADNDPLAPLEASVLAPGRTIVLSSFPDLARFGAPAFSTPIDAEELVSAISRLLRAHRAR